MSALGVSVMAHFVDELLALEDPSVAECDFALSILEFIHGQGILSDEEADRLAESVRTRRHMLADFAW